MTSIGSIWIFSVSRIVSFQYFIIACVDWQETIVAVQIIQEIYLSLKVF